MRDDGCGAVGMRGAVGRAFVCASWLFAGACSGDSDAEEGSDGGGVPVDGGADGATAEMGPIDVEATQDLWVLRALRAVHDDGNVSHLLDPLAELAVGDAGEGVPISATATFRPSPALTAHLQTREGERRDGLDVVGGVIEDGDAMMVAFFATPRVQAAWPGTDDVLAFVLPEVEGLDTGVPLVAEYQFVQTLPSADATLDEADANDATALLAARLLAQSYQYAATTDDVDLVFTGQVGEVLDTVHVDDPPGVRTQAQSAFGGGIPPKAKPYFDGFNGGVGKCVTRFFKPGASSLKCVKDILDGQKKGARGTNDLLNDNLGPEPGPRPRPTPTPRYRDKPRKRCLFACGGGANDPHMFTFDGRRYDLQQVGEFVAARATDVEVQIRSGPVPGSRRAAYVTRVAIEAGGHLVEVPLGLRDPILVDGDEVAVEVAGSDPLTLDDVEIWWEPRGVDIWLGGEPRVAVDRHAHHLNFFVESHVADGRWVGLLGDHDGKREGDLVSRDGSSVDPPTADLYAAFTDTWRLDPNESLFTYADGEDTETFTDRTFPDESATVSDLSAAKREQARTLCMAAGITTQPLLDECVLDYALTGDISMVHGAQASLAAERASRVADHSTFDGFVTEQSVVFGSSAQLQEIRGGEIAVGDGLALVRTQLDGTTTLRAIDLWTGQERWTAPNTDFRCRPVVVEGLGVAVQLQRNAGDVGSDSPVALLSIEDGRELARTSEPTAQTGCSRSLSALGSVVVQPQRNRLRAFDAADGMKLLWTYESGEILWEHAVPVMGHFVAFTRELPTVLTVRAFDPRTGAQRGTLAVPGGAQAELEVLGRNRVAAIADNADSEPRATTVVELAEDGSLSQVWTRDYADETELRQPRQLTAFGGYVVGWSTYPGGTGLVALDSETGALVWTHAATSFDNSVGLVELVGLGQAVAIVPFGGAWIELVDRDGTATPVDTPPFEGPEGPQQITSLPDGRFIATGRYIGADASETGVYFLFLEL